MNEREAVQKAESEFKSLYFFSGLGKHLQLLETKSNFSNLLRHFQEHLDNATFPKSNSSKSSTDNYTRQTMKILKFENTATKLRDLTMTHLLHQNTSITKTKYTDEETNEAVFTTELDQVNKS